MIVADASAVIEMLTRSKPDRQLAEALDLPLVTCDAKLRPNRRAHEADVRVYG